MHALLALLVCALPPRPQSPWPQAVQQPTPKQQQVFALLDEFDPLDTAALPFVEVDTGVWEGAPHQVVRRHGFLLQASNSRFRVR